MVATTLRYTPDQAFHSSDVTDQPDNRPLALADYPREIAGQARPQTLKEPQK
jgi:hypothetical protein